MTEVRVPDIGDFDDVPVIEILVAVGDAVAAEDPLVTLESDKATMDVPAPFAGTVTELRVAVGDRVSKGSVLLTIETEGADQAETPAPSPEPASASEPAPTSQPSAATSPPAAASPPADEYDADVVVIGSGPGGYSAAFRAADLGLTTIMIERYETLGGVCLNVGCIPSKALLHAARVITEAQEMSEHGISFGKPTVSLEKLTEWKQSVVSRLTGGIAQMAKGRAVEVVTGEATFIDDHSVRVGDRTISFASCIIAAGSQAVTLPFLPEDPRIIDSTGALNPDELPKRLLVIGGGIIGLEMACVYDALGVKVTVVELLDQLIPGCDPDLINPLAKRIQGRYEAIMLGTGVTAVKAQKNGLKVEFSAGKPQLFDQILVAVGRTPNGNAVGADAAGVTVDARGYIPVDARMRTNVPHIYAIGDIVGEPMLAHKATHEAHVAAEVIAGTEGAEFDPRAIPSVAYTDPEVAWMGLTEMAAREQGIEYEKATFPWVASGRALALTRPEGMTKLLVEPETRRVLGAGIVGVGAGDLIAETVLALELGADAEDLALTIHPHPTLSESVGLAAELAQGTITDLPPPRKRKQP
jgi:dihydrolipoamide dehydrogenase